jgi:hypothetical protein
VGREWAEAKAMDAHHETDEETAAMVEAAGIKKEEARAR